MGNSRPQRRDYAPCQCHDRGAEHMGAHEFPDFICGGCEEYAAAVREWEMPRDATIETPVAGLPANATDNDDDCPF